MKHENIIQVYYHDTDCYGVVWHGAYIKWFEIGRVEYSRLIGIDFKELEKMKIMLPVVELNCRYKNPARLMDQLCITTELKEIKKVSISYSHTIKNINTNTLILNAASTIVTTDRDGRLFKRIPDYLYDKFAYAVNNSQLTVNTK